MNPVLELKLDADHREWLRLELADAWRAAQDEAVVAYEYWREQPGPTGYTVYRAAQDRADQAQELLTREAQHEYA